MSLFQMSLSGAVLVLLSAGIRALFLHRLPKRTFVALWDLSLLRLLVPYTLPSPLSAYALFTKLTARSASPTVAPAAAYTQGTGNGFAALPAAPPAAPGVPSPVLPDLWTLLWLAGALACGGFFLASYLRFRREFQASLPVRQVFAENWLRQHPLRRPVTLRQSGRISAPLTYGILRPVILLPETADPEDESALTYALVHELIHIRRFDALRKLALVLAACIHWCNPAVWLLLSLANRDIELSCDEAVLRQVGTGQKSAYAMALIRMEEQKSVLPAFSSSFSKNVMKERITAIMKIRKTSRWALCAALILLLGVTTVFATSAPSGERRDRGLNGTTVIRDQTMMSYTDPADGKTYYSTDGGKTFEPLTDKEFAARYSPPEEYEPLGLTLKEAENALYYRGQKVRYFQDSADLGDGGVASRCVYYREDGAVSLRTVRKPEANPDGSTNPFGPILRLETLSAREAERLIQENVLRPEQVAVTTELEAQRLDNEAQMKPYAPFGLTWSYDSREDFLELHWRGKTVHSLWDAEAGVWIANNLYGSDLGPDAVDLEAVYENGKLTGLRESGVHGAGGHPATTMISAETEAGGTGEGTPLPGMFDQFKPYDVAYRETVTEGAMERNLYFHGKPVNHFADIKPDGGVFTFSSTRQSEDGLTLRTVYENGKLTGVAEAGD